IEEVAVSVEVQSLAQLGDLEEAQAPAAERVLEGQREIDRARARNGGRIGGPILVASGSEDGERKSEPRTKAGGHGCSCAKVREGKGAAPRASRVPGSPAHHRAIPGEPSGSDRAAPSAGAQDREIHSAREARPCLRSEERRVGKECR